MALAQTSMGGSALLASGRMEAFTLPGGTEPPHLWGGRCADCGAVDFPPARFCSRCSSRRVERVALSRRGVIHVWSTVYQDPGPSFIGEKPFTIVNVELPEGVRVVSTLWKTVPAECFDRGLPVELDVREVAKDEHGAPLYDFRFLPVNDRAKE